MDFARKQLEKYGWKDGKGLGKHENGISEALKPKLKHSVTGVGHDAASEFNEHWWETLYDKAVTNIQVEDKHGTTKKIKTVDEDNFEITNSMWHLTNNKKKQKQNGYQSYFVKKSTLTQDGVKVEECSSSDEEIANVAEVMTDEQLFAACGRRTAHKGARHGLKALGKLARIEEQERQMLLLSKYDGYSHAEAMKIPEITNTDTNLDEFGSFKVKKKKNKEINNKIITEDLCKDTSLNETNNSNVIKKKKIDKHNKEISNENITEDICKETKLGVIHSSKGKKKKNKDKCLLNELNNEGKITKNIDEDTKLEAIDSLKVKKKKDKEITEDIICKDKLDEINSSDDKKNKNKYSKDKEISNDINNEDIVDNNNGIIFKIKKNKLNKTTHEFNNSNNFKNTDIAVENVKIKKTKRKNNDITRNKCDHYNNTDDNEYSSEQVVKKKKKRHQ